MTFGLRVRNERNNIVLDEEIPYRFTSPMRSMTYFDAGFGVGQYAADITGAGPSTLICVDLPQDRFCAWGVKSKGDPDTHWFDFPLALIEEYQSRMPAGLAPIQFCLAERIRSHKTTSSFGIEISDHSGQVLLNSDNRLLSFDQCGVIDIEYDPAAPSSETYIGTSTGLFSAMNMTYSSGFGSDYYAVYYLEVIRRGDSYYARKSYSEDGHGIHPPPTKQVSTLVYGFTNRPA